MERTVSAPQHMHSRYLPRRHSELNYIGGRQANRQKDSAEIQSTFKMNE